MTNIRKQKADFNSEYGKVSKRRIRDRDGGKPLLIPRNVRKPDIYIKTLDHILDTIARAPWDVISYRHKGFNRRTARILFELLNDAIGLKVFPGYKFDQNHWKNTKLHPSPALRYALESYPATSKQPERVLDPFAEKFMEFWNKEEWIGCGSIIIRVNKHDGRIYSCGSDHYQGLHRWQRVRLKTVSGKEFVELDIRASHPTALMGLYKVATTLDAYPYDLPGFPVEQVKWVFTRLIGSTADGIGKLHTSWKQVKKPQKPPNFPGNPKALGQALIRKNPHLKCLPKGTLFDLTQREALVIISVMEQLYDMGIICLPNHDGVLVEREHQQLALSMLEKAYFHEFGIVPWIKVITKENEPDPYLDEEIINSRKKPKLSSYSRHQDTIWFKNLERRWKIISSRPKVKKSKDLQLELVDDLDKRQQIRNFILQRLGIEAATSPEFSLSRAPTGALVKIQTQNIHETSVAVGHLEKVAPQLEKVAAPQLEKVAPQLEKVAPHENHGGVRSKAGRKKMECRLKMNISKDKFYRLKRGGKLLQYVKANHPDLLAEIELYVKRNVSR